jgi:3-methylcrotonyl-CoA carboxylase alpha subunit
MADEAHLIGPAPARESYLKADAIIDAAKRTGAQAVHPGYGFLSENAGFADACAQAGIVFIGPPAASIRAMGSKSEAKKIMEKARVPLVPGYHGDDQSPELLAREAARIGYPVLIKASAGGGGKGMRIVEREGDLAEAIAGAQREAKSSFGDDRLLVEKYLQKPRHIEIQVFADKHGNAVYLFERDCSLQRRHQKVIEEAPAPGMDEKRRRAMGEAAVKAARAVGYEGAGTVEFIADSDGSFFFMEMNTRLQVEHPVTEMITGLDLVEWQLRVASGEKLPLLQDQLRIDGHAFEARLYAEDPTRDFLPATGRLHHLRFPEENAHVRVDTGVRSGDAISIHYDPMIAKLVVWDRDRAAALHRLTEALAGCEIVGLTTNVAFLRRVALNPSFAAGEVDTGFIARHRAELVPAPTPISDRLLGLAALGILLLRQREAEAAALASADPHSPWHRATGWRLNDDAFHVLRLKEGGRDLALTAHFRRDGFVLDLPSGAVAARGTLDADGQLTADLGGVATRATIVRQGDDIVVFADGESRRLSLFNPMHAAAGAEGAGGRLTAPMPGKVVAVKSEAGARVKRGAPLLVLEAMKMEHTIAAPADGTVESIRYRAGDQVDEGAELVKFKADSDT